MDVDGRMKKRARLLALQGLLKRVSKAISDGYGKDDSPPMEKSKAEKAKETE